MKGTNKISEKIGFKLFNARMYVKLMKGTDKISEKIWFKLFNVRIMFVKQNPVKDLRFSFHSFGSKRSSSSVYLLLKKTRQNK